MTILELMERFGISPLPGTGIVLVAMIILIAIVMRIDKAITARFPPEPETTAAPAHFAPAYAAAGDGGAITAAIAAAVNEYRKTK
jgi:sodium pump decarboxylase gamma subunit